MALNRGWKVYDGTSGNVLIGRISSKDLQYTMKTEETAASDDTADKPEPTVFSGSKLTLKGKIDTTDAGQLGLKTKFLAGTHINPVKVVKSGTVGGSGVGDSFEGVITDWQEGDAYGKYVDVTITILVYGTVTPSTSL